MQNQLTALDIAEAHSQDAVYQELQPHMQQNVPTEVDVRPQQHAEDSHSKVPETVCVLQGHTACMYYVNFTCM